MMRSFTGFPREGFTFLAELTANNNREWFRSHEEEYRTYLLEPAFAFVEKMGEELKKFAPSVIADPRINGSIFRIHRDVRFSRDKRPYKTHMGIRFRDGRRQQAAGCSEPVFYLHLEPAGISVGGGLHKMTKADLERYRISVDDNAKSSRILEILDDLYSREFRIEGDVLKRVPPPFDSDHPRADLLRRKGLFAMHDTPVFEEVHSSDFIDFCIRIYRSINPLYQWLRSM